MVTETQPTTDQPQAAALAPTGVTPEPNPEPVADEPHDVVEGEEAPKPFFHDIADEDGLWEHEQVKTRLESERETAKNAGRDAAIEEFLPHVTANSKKVADLTEYGKKALGRIIKLERDDPTALDRFSEEHGYDLKETLQNIVDGVYVMSGALKDGRKLTILELARAAGDESIANPFNPRIDSLLSGIPDVTWAKDFVRKLTEQKEKDAYERGQKAGYDKGKADAATVAKAQLRANGGGPNLTPEGRPAGSSIKTLADAERRYNLPAGHPEHISHEQMREAAKRFGASYA